jgi:hypothetical protein
MKSIFLKFRAMIEIQELAGLDREGIINLLLEQQEQPFDIYVPKETQRYFSEREAICSDYANLAYAGQWLFEVANSFAYDEISPDDHESVLFQITTENIDGLAAVLLDISFGYVNDHEDEEFSYFELVEAFIDDVQGSKIEPACPYFIEIFNEFLKED